MMLNFRKHFEKIQRPALEASNRCQLICLDKNEAPFSPLKEFDFAPENIFTDSARQYPDPYPLYQKLATHLGLSSEQLLLSFGSEQALRYTFELMLGVGDEVVFLDPSFAMFEVFAEQFQAKVTRVSHDQELEVHVQRILEAIRPTTKLVVIANPNNPAGTLIPLKDMRLLAEKVQEIGAMLVIDEAYHPYSETTCLPLIDEFENCVITRSFSKGWGLAGVRAGYLICHPKYNTLFRSLKPIDEISTFSLAVCLFALEHPEILEKNVQQVKKWKSQFTELECEKIQTIENHANFILLRLKDEIRHQFIQRVRQEGILIKESLPFPLEEAVRFSVSEDAVMQKLYDILLELK